MKLSLSMKTLFRSPVRTALTFVLLGIVSFALFMRVNEYAITRREFNNAISQYRGVGAAEATPANAMVLVNNPDYIKTDPRLSQLEPDDNREWFESLRYRPITGEQIAAIAAIPYISLVDTRYMTAGFSDNYYRLDEGPSFIITRLYASSRRR